VHKSSYSPGSTRAPHGEQPAQKGSSSDSRKERQGTGGLGQISVSGERHFFIRASLSD